MVYRHYALAKALDKSYVQDIEHKFTITHEGFGFPN
jgi:hypothetical protein